MNTVGISRTVALLGVGVVAGMLYKNEKGETIVDTAFENVTGKIQEGYKKVKRKRKPTQTTIDTKLTKERITNFYKSVLQANDGVEFGQPIKETEDLTFTTYSEAKVKMLDSMVKPGEVDATDKKEIYSLIMDYGSFVREKLTKEEGDSRTEEIIIEP